MAKAANTAIPVQSSAVGGELTAGKIAQLLGAELIGDSERKVSALKPLEAAGYNDISFFAPTSARVSSELLQLAKSSNAAAILTNKPVDGITATQIVVKHPLAAAVQIAQILHPKPLPALGVDETARIHSTATIGENVRIAAYVVIGEGVTIGNNVVIHPHVVIYPHAQIGDDCVIHSGAAIREGVILGADCQIQNGAVIGGDGFGYFPDPQVGHRRIPHVGTVVLSKSVDVGSNSTVDRGTFGETKIGIGTKLDNLVMIGHNVIIGARSLLCGQVGISGSTRVGDDVILAGQVGVADHCHIGNRVKIGAKSGVTGNIKEGQTLIGYPVTEQSRWRRMQISLLRFPETMIRLRKIEKKLGIESEEQ